MRARWWVGWAALYAACTGSNSLSADAPLGDAPLALDAPVADAPLAMENALVADARTYDAPDCPDGSVPSCPICGPAPVDPGRQCAERWPECRFSSCILFSDCTFHPPGCDIDCAICIDGCVVCDRSTRKWQLLILDDCYGYELYCHGDAGP